MVLLQSIKTQLLTRALVEVKGQHQQVEIQMELFILRASQDGFLTHLGVNGTTHTAVQLHIELRTHMRVKDTRFRNVPTCSGRYCVSDDEFDSLILGQTVCTWPWPFWARPFFLLLICTKIKHPIERQNLVSLSLFPATSVACSIPQNASGSPALQMHLVLSTMAQVLQD